MSNKIYKPKSCTECCVFVAEKGKVGRCKCMPSNKKIFNSLREMYNECPLEWDKKEKNNE